MIDNDGGSPGKALWAYAYEIVPAQIEDGLFSIQGLLDEEHGAALCGTRTWAGRIVYHRRMTHILVVSDGPEQDREVNRKLETELASLEVRFALTVPLAIPDDRPSPPQVGGASETPPGVPGKRTRRRPLE